MAKVKYVARENKKVGTHSFYAEPVFNGTLSFDELMEEACEDNTYSIDEMRGCVGRFMKAVQREVLRGWRCKLGQDFLTIYPNLNLSVKDYSDKKTGELVVATAAMLNAGNGRSRLGASVSTKFSQKFAQEVSWQKIDSAGNPIDEEDITQNNENTEGSDNTQNDTQGNTQGSGTTSSGSGDE